MNDPNKTTGEEKSNVDFDHNEGARKVALFLSALDSETADRLLSLLDPKLVRAITSEAKTIASASSRDVESIISEFLDNVSISSQGSKDGSWTRPMRRLGDVAVSSCGDERSSKVAKAPKSLENIPLQELVSRLCGERFALIAAVFTELSQERRTALTRLLPFAKQTLVSRAFVKTNKHDALTRAERILINGGSKDE